MRKDILTGEWVIFSRKRKEKPYHFKRITVAQSGASEDCPFCPGHEKETPVGIYQNGEDGNWNIRVFNNMYPAVDSEKAENIKEDFYCAQDGIGIHEVLVDTPVHSENPENFSQKHLLDVLKVIQQRFLDIEKEDFIKYVQIFKNNGAEAGASIAHSHWQIMGVSVVPKEQETVINSLKKYKEERNSCLICDMVKHELKNEERVVLETEEFVAIVPYAPKLGFELWILPKEHINSFSMFSKKHLQDLSKAMIKLLSAVKELREGVCYNLCFQDSPKDYKSDFHWYLKILPRIGAPAGFEMGTGCYINPLLPEEAAKKYKQILNKSIDL
ncbi:MAG: galactose-1-phosphate uridylyltransferase [Anaerotignaceae bacterium]